MSGSLHIRPATSDDCRQVNDIYNFYVRTSPATFDTVETTDEWRADWFATHLAQRMPVLVADDGGVVAGWCCLSRWSPKRAYDTTADESIYIADHYRSRGVGRTLLSAILDEARRIDVQVVMAGIVACQSPSLGLHRALGFEQSALHLHMGFKLGAWHDVAYLQRHLWQDEG